VSLKRADRHLGAHFLEVAENAAVIQSHETPIALQIQQQVRRDDLGGRVGAHAAGFRNGVTVADAFMVLGGRQDHIVASGNDHEEGGLLAGEAVFDQNLRFEI